MYLTSKFILVLIQEMARLMVKQEIRLLVTVLILVGGLMVKIHLVQRLVLVRKLLAHQ